MNYYDVVLLMVPLSFLGASGSVFATGMPLEVSVMVGGIISVGLIGHAMFVNPPMDSLPKMETQHSQNSATLGESVVSDD